MSGVAPSFGVATAEIRVLRTGVLEVRQNEGSWIADPNEWISANGGATVGDNYEIRFWLPSGPEPTGSAVNAWLPLTVTRTWTSQTSAGFTKDVNGTLQLRVAGTGTIIESGAVRLLAISIGV